MPFLSKSDAVQARPSSKPCDWGFTFPLPNAGHALSIQGWLRGEHLLAAKTTTNDNFPFCHLSAPLLGRQFIFLP